MTEKDLDKFVRSKIAEAQFEFNPENWQRMEAILDEDRPVLVSYWRQAIGLGTAAVFLGLTIFLLGPSPSSSSPLTPKSLEQLGQEELVAPGSNGRFSPSQSQYRSQAKGETSFDAAPKVKNLGQEGETTAQNKLLPKQKSGSTTLRPNEALPPGLWVEAKALTLASLPYNDPPLFRLLPFDLGMSSRFEPAALEKFKGIHEVLVEAAPSMNSSYNTQPGFGGSFGLVYRYRFSQKWNMQAGLNYFRRGNLGLQTATDSVFFGLGRTEVRTAKHYKQLRGFGIPLAVEYEFLPGHQIAVGAYLQVVQSVLVQIDSTYHQFKQDPQHFRYQVIQDRPEIHNFNYGLNLAYAYQINPQFSLGLAFNYGLADLTQDSYRSFEGHHNLVTGQLRLRYRLF